MTTPLQRHIHAKEGTEFYKEIAAFSFEGFLAHRFGAVLVREGFFGRHPDGMVDAVADYVPCGTDSELPQEAVAMIDKYTPENEVVMVILGADGQATCLTLSAQKMGCTPFGVYMLRNGWHVDYPPGSVLRLKEPIGEVQRGYYVFMREDQALLKLKRAGMDEDEGRMVALEDRIDIHIDYRDFFEPTGVNVYAERE